MPSSYWGNEVKVWVRAPSHVYRYPPWTVRKPLLEYICYSLYGNIKNPQKFHLTSAHSLHALSSVPYPSSLGSNSRRVDIVLLVMLVFLGLSFSMYIRIKAFPNFLRNTASTCLQLDRKCCAATQKRMFEKACLSFSKRRYSQNGCPASSSAVRASLKESIAFFTEK